MINNRIKKQTPLIESPTEEMAPQIGRMGNTIVSPSYERSQDNPTWIAPRMIEFMYTYNKSQSIIGKIPTQVPHPSMAREDVFQRKLKDVPKTKF